MLKTELNSLPSYDSKDNLIVLSDRNQLGWADKLLSVANVQLLQHMAQQKAKGAMLTGTGRWVIVEFLPTDLDPHQRAEVLRKAAGKRIAELRNAKIEQITLVNQGKENFAAAYLEGLVLGNYQFIKYYKDTAAKRSVFRTINIPEATIAADLLQEIQTVLEGVIITRDLVNEPQSYLDAVQLAKEMQTLSPQAGFSCTTFDKAKIEQLGMGGLLAVNKGSIIPPTFTIMEWKPENAKNSKPIVLVGKGVVYDTGGLSLKPTANSMDFMKSDMGGAALVIGSMYAIAKNKLPVHVIGLIPATDNRPGQEAYAPGDVIKMYSGDYVEVLNTDAEGRMLLADALHYAKQYEPSFVFDFATLTGSAARAIGRQASVIMGNVDDEIKNKVKASGERVYERSVEFPIWDEYAEELQSDIADIKNLGGPFAGAITAGKFLQHFTDYPWLHFDIAGVAFLHKENSYQVKGGTGYGVRLMYTFFKQLHE